MERLAVEWFFRELACVAGVKRVGGRGGGREFGQKMEDGVSFFSSSPTPSPLYACYAGYRRLYFYLFIIIISSIILIDFPQ